MAKKPTVTRPASLAELASAGYRFDPNLEAATATPEEQAEPTGAMRRVLQDGGISLLKGAISVPEAAVGLLDIPTGGRAGKVAQSMGFRPAEAKAMLDEQYTPETKAALQKVQQADGFVGKLGAAIENPSVIGTAVAESVPMMGAGGVIGRGLTAVAPRMSALVGGAAGEGIVSAGSAAEQIRQQTGDGLLTPEQSALAGLTGVGTAAFGLAGGKVAKQLGIGDVDTMLAQGSRAAGQAAALEATKKGLVRKFLEGAVSEGVLEELPQSMQEQVLQNAALGKPLDDGVDQAAALGLLSGMAMGGPAGALGGGSATAEQVRGEKLPEAGPMSRAVNAGIETTAKDIERGAAVPGLTAEQENDALSRMEAVMASDQKGLKVYGGGYQPAPVPPGVAQGASSAPGATTLDGFAKVVDSPFADRVLELNDALRDPTTRAAIEAKFGPDAYGEVLYYLNLANQPQDHLPAAERMPERTRDRLLQISEAIVSQAVLQPLGESAPNGARFAGPADPALAGPAAQPRIGLDTEPTGTIRVDGQGNAAPETRADAISTKQRADTAAVLGTGARKPAAPAPTRMAALTNNPTPSGRMVAGQDGVRVETVAEVQARQRQTEADAELGLTPDVRRAQQQRKGADDGNADSAARGPGNGSAGGNADAGRGGDAGGRAADSAVAAVPGGNGRADAEGRAGNVASGVADGALKADRWNKAPRAEREQLLAAAGWAMGEKRGKNTEVVLGRAWDKMSDSQRARIGAAMESSNAAAPQPAAEAARGQEAAPAADRAAASGEQRPAAGVPAAGSAGVEADGVADKPKNLPFASKLPPTDIRMGDKVIVDGKVHTVSGGIEGGISAMADVPENGSTTERFLKGDDAIRAKIEADKAGLNGKPKTASKELAEAQPEKAIDRIKRMQAEKAGNVATTGAADGGIEARIAGAEAAGVTLSGADKDAIRGALTQAENLRRKAGGASARGADPMRKGNAFPMGVGFTKMTKRAEQRIDASVRRAGEAVELWKQADQFEAQANAMLAGKGTAADKASKAASKEKAQRLLISKLLAWKKGDKIGPMTVERVNKDRDGYPATYTISGDGIIKGVMDKVDVVREMFDGDKNKFRAMVDEARPDTADSAPAPAEATHKDPGEPAESASPEVVAESLTKAAKAEDRKPAAMLAELLGKIDEAITEAPDYQDFQAAVKSMGEKDAIAVFTTDNSRSAMGDTYPPKGYSRPTRTFDIVGDGKFTVHNTVRQLLRFKQNVKDSPGFKNSKTPAPPVARVGDALDKRGHAEAISNMLDEGDFEAATDYAAAVGVKLDEVKLTQARREALEKWQKDRQVAGLRAENDARAQRDAKRYEDKTDDERAQDRETLREMAEDTSFPPEVRARLKARLAEFEAVEAKRKPAAEPDEIATSNDAAPLAAEAALAPAAADDEKPASNTPTVDAHFDTIKALNDGDATVESYRAAFAAARDGEATIKAELNKLTKIELERTLGPMYMSRPGEKKAEMVDALYQAMLRQYALGKSYGPSGYMMGMRASYEREKAAALDALVDGQTADDLAAYAAERKTASEERKAARAATKAAIENPQSVDDFRNFIRFHKGEGKDFKQARMLLTPEQRARYDSLEAELTRSGRKQVQDERRDVRVAGQTVDGNIIATKHTRKGHDLFVVQLAERVAREDYDTLNASAKRMGGYYSSFRGNGAVPGFQFDTRAQAEAFVKLAQGDKADAQAVAAERRDAFADDRSQSAAERLTEMADKMEADADESLSRERKANTARRARFAAAAEAGAREAKAMAKTMRNVAEALTSGKAKFLDRIRTKTQVELLQTYVANAKGEELRAKYPTYAEQEKRKGQPPTQETADYAEFPTFTAFRSDLASLGRQLQDVDGTKKIGDQLMKVADDVSNAFTAWVKEPGNYLRVAAFSTKGTGERAGFSSKDAAERAIARSGYRGKAIPWSIKRGEWTVIMSPSEAVARGIWTGDGDKRITLTAEFGAEMVEKMGRANRRGAKVSVPWQFERAYERRKQLQRMGIETPAEFRAALREFIGLREQAAEADKIKAMERAMVGRRNDGLDFFPTPESVADEMVAAADIQPDMAVLEPSAGMGHIADRIRAAGAEPDVVEMAGDRRELLQEKGYTLQGSDFLALKPREFFTYGDVFRAPDGTEGVMRSGNSMNRVRLVNDAGAMVGAGFYDRDELVGVRHRGSDSGYDRILMNPPFSDGRDIEHVRHAYTLLKPGGRIVALMGESAFTNQNKRATEFREWLESVGGTNEKLAEGTFNDPSLPVNTGANARMVVIDKVDAKTGTYDDADRPAFSRTDAAPAEHMTVDEVRAAVERLTAGWANAPRVEVIEGMDDPKVPQAVRDEDGSQSSRGASGEPEGFFFDGVAYLHAGHMRTEADVRRVLFHEALGHYGLRGLYGKALIPILDQIIAARRQEVRAKAREYGLDANNRADLYAAAEEVLAEMAQSRPELGFVKRAISAVRAWLRSIGLNLRLTDDDIVAQYLLPARRFVEQAGQAKVSGETAAFTRGKTAAVPADTNAPGQTGAAKGADSGNGSTARRLTKADFAAFQAFVSQIEALAEKHGKVFIRWSPTAARDLKIGAKSRDFVAGTTHDGLSAVEIDSSTHPVDIAKALATYGFLRMQDSASRPRVYIGDRVGTDSDFHATIKATKVVAEVPEEIVRAMDAHADTAMALADDIETIKARMQKPLAPGVIADYAERLAAKEKQLKNLFSNEPSASVNSDAQPVFSRSTMAEAMRDSINSARSFALPAGYIADDFITTHAKLGFWQKTVGTPYNLAKKNPAFRRVFDAVQSFLGDVSSYATEAADLAPRILPKLETLADLKKAPLSPADTQALSRPVFEGTLLWRRDENGEPVRVDEGGEGPAGIVWDASELRSMFGLTEPQIALYREFRAAVDESLRSLTVSEMVRVAGKDIEGMREQLMGMAPHEAADKIADVLAELVGTAGSAGRKAALAKTGERVNELAKRYGQLVEQGYAPLSRFGTNTLDVVDADGARVYFGLFESTAEANRMARKMRAAYPAAEVTQGTLSQEAYKQFAGVSPETVALFGDLMGLDEQGDTAKDAVFQEYLKRAKSTRSAMRRLIHRKGIAGFSEDAGRVLAGFIYSNARSTSANLHQGDIGEAVQAIPKGQGELADYALKMAEYTRNPQEEAQKLKSIMFAQFLGGSIASAMVNMTQPIAVTFPYLSQFGGAAAAAKQLTQAIKDNAKRDTGDAALNAALKRAEEEGIVSPQEVFHLMAQAQGSGALKAGDGTKLGNASAAASNALSKLSLAWGKLFSVAEQFNRRVTFIAAYRMAPAGTDPAKFAAEAVTETQFTYNKGNKPQWARGMLGSLLFTFKQYSINYVELLARMANSGPEGRKAALLAVAVLALMGGADELPFLKDAQDVVDGLLQRLGYNFNSENARNRFLAELIGKDAARFVAKGVTGIPGVPIDISGRLGMGNLIPGTGVFLKRTDYTNDVLEIAGPAAKLGQNAFKAAGALVEGRAGEAVQALLPVAAQNALKGADMAVTGQYKDTKGRKVIDTTVGEALAKSIGFQPESVARVQEAADDVTRTVQLVKQEKAEIQADWAQGLADGDRDAVENARQRLVAWNRNNPEAPIRVNVRDIRKKVVTLKEDRATRLEKAAPKAIRADVKKQLAEASGG